MAALRAFDPGEAIHRITAIEEAGHDPLYNNKEVPVSTRIAAYRGLARSQGDEAVGTLLTMLRDEANGVN